MVLNCRVGTATHKSLQKQRTSEDTFFISPEGRLAVIADGMGPPGSERLALIQSNVEVSAALDEVGLQASSLAVEAIQRLWTSNPPTQDEALQEWLRQAVTEADNAVFRLAAQLQSGGVGTTIVVVLKFQKQDRFLVAHVGDSRAYVIRNGKPVLRTSDHTVVQEMVQLGRLTEEQARENPYRNLLTRCLGQDNQFDLDITEFQVTAGDWILLCTKGLTSVLTDKQIFAAVHRGSDPQKVCDQLVQGVLDCAAPEDTTVVAVEVFDPQSRSGRLFGWIRGT